MQSVTLRTDMQWGPAGQHGELCPIPCDGTWWMIIRERECTDVWLGPFAPQQKLTEQCKSTIIEKIKT